MRIALMATLPASDAPGALSLPYQLPLPRSGLAS
jgi:hypothetical protein